MEIGNNTLQIYTLGRFIVKKGDRLLTGGNQRARKRWRLFQMFFTYQDQGLSLDRIINYLGLEETVNPPEALKSLVYYLRKDLQKTGETGGCGKYIINNNGLYQFNKGADYWLDAEQFEKWCNQARKLSFEAREEALTVYRNAFGLYHGDYLVGVGPVGWVLSARNHYRNLYLRAIVDATGLLKEAGKPEEVIDLCENGLQINPLEESLHRIILETLLDNGRIGQARMRYEEALAIFEQNDLEPSLTLKNLGRHFLKNTGEISTAEEEYDDFFEREELQLQDGAFVCDRETFMYIYKLEKAKSERGKAGVFPLKLMLVGEDIGFHNKLLEHILKRELRKGDVVCNWDQYNIFILLSDSTPEHRSTNAIDRVRQQFDLQKRGREVQLQTQLFEYW